MLSKIKNIIRASESSPFEGMSTNDVIDQIHREFKSEGEAIIHEANRILEIKSELQQLKSKRDTLLSFGFESSPEVKEANRIVGEAEKKEALAEAYMHFSVIYPKYKLINLEAVNRICEKYGLIFSDVSRFTGIVPDENLREISEAMFKAEDKCFVKIRTSIFGESEREFIGHVEYNMLRRGPYTSLRTTVEESRLMIAAPRKDFNLSESEMIGNELVSKIEIPDPVVMQPVLFKKERYFLVVTAWGQEAEDKDVINQKSN